jgi:hypothetical protein
MATKRPGPNRRPLLALLGRHIPALAVISDVGFDNRNDRQEQRGKQKVGDQQILVCSNGLEHTSGLSTTVCADKRKVAGRGTHIRVVGPDPSRAPVLFFVGHAGKLGTVTIGIGFPLFASTLADNL